HAHWARHMFVGGCERPIIEMLSALAIAALGPPDRQSTCATRNHLRAPPPRRTPAGRRSFARRSWVRSLSGCTGNAAILAEVLQPRRFRENEPSPTRRRFY